MTPAPAVSERATSEHRRRPPLILGLVMIAVVAVGYLGWQHFAHEPAATRPEPPPPVPVIATTVKSKISRSC